MNYQTKMDREHGLMKTIHFVLGNCYADKS